MNQSQSARIFWAFFTSSGQGSRPLSLRREFLRKLIVDGLMYMLQSMACRPEPAREAMCLKGPRKQTVKITSRVEGTFTGMNAGVKESRSDRVLRSASCRRAQRRIQLEKESI